LVPTNAREGGWVCDITNYHNRPLSHHSLATAHYNGQ